MYNVIFRQPYLSALDMVFAWESLLLASSVILKDWKISKSASSVSFFNSLFIKAFFFFKFPFIFYYRQQEETRQHFWLFGWKSP